MPRKEDHNQSDGLDKHSGLKFPLLLSCSSCQNLVRFDRGAQLSFGDVLCARHKDRPEYTLPASQVKVSQKKIAKSGTPVRKMTQEQGAMEKTAEPQPSGRRSSLQTRQSKTPRPAPSTPSEGRSRNGTRTAAISSGLMTPPATPPSRVLPEGAAVMVRVGKTSWPAKIAKLSADGLEYLVHFDGVQKGRNAWHAVDDIEAIDDVGRRCRTVTHHYTC